MEFVKSKIAAVVGLLLPFGFEYLASDTPDFGWVVVPALCLAVAGYLVGVSCYAIFHHKWSTLLWLFVFAVMVAAAVWLVGVDSLKRSPHDQVRDEISKRVRNSNSSRKDSLMRDALRDFEDQLEARRKEDLKNGNGDIGYLLESRFKDSGGFHAMMVAASRYDAEETQKIEQHYCNFLEFLKQVSVPKWGAILINVIAVVIVAAIASIWLSGVLTFLIAKLFL